MAITSHPLPSADDFVRLEGELFERLERSHTRKVRRHRLVVAAAVVLVAAGGTTAAGTVANSDRQANSAICYSHGSTSSRSAEVLQPSGVDGSSAGSRLVTRADSAIASCLSVYEIGAVGKPVAHPKLQACIEDNLVVAVFPKSKSTDATTFCDDLGMSAP